MHPVVRTYCTRREEVQRLCDDDTSERNAVWRRSGSRRGSRVSVRRQQINCNVRSRVATTDYTARIKNGSNLVDLFYVKFRLISLEVNRRA